MTSQTICATFSTAPRSHFGGFTLIEVLIAILILATVLPIALAGISASLRGVSQVRNQDVALRVAQSRLNLLVAESSWTGSGKAGSCDPVTDGEDAVDFRWEVSVTPWRDPYLSTLRVTVLWGNPLDPQSVALETIVTPIATTTL
jgi:type II secretion system protein I